MSLDTIFQWHEPTLPGSIYVFPIIFQLMRHSLSKTFSFLALSLSIALASCSGHGNYMAFTDNVVYVEEFPEKYSLTGAEEVNTGVLGAYDFRIVDSVMVFMANGAYAWKAVSLDDTSKTCNLLRVGNGPGEVISVSTPSQVDFYEDGGEIYCDLFDMNKREMYRMNFSESLETGQTKGRIVAERLPSLSMAMIALGDSTYFYKSLVDNMTSYRRSIFKDGESFTPEWLEALNSAHVDPGKDFNLLSATTRYDRSRNMVVEIPVRLNNINLYTLDGSFRKSVNIGSRLSDIDKLQEIDMAEHPMTFLIVQMYDGFFAAIYLGETVASYLGTRTQMPHIYCFDYEGNPLADILLDEQVTSFDFDFEGGWLYVLDQMTDRMWRYALPDGFDLK